MRIGAALFLMLGLIGPAAADEPRYRPPLGAVATYRFLTTVTANGKDTTFGYVYRLTTTSSNDTGSESAMTFLTMLFGCPAGATGMCPQARNYPGAAHDGDMISVPIPPEVSANLAAFGKVGGRDFIRSAQAFPIPGPEDIDDIAKPRIGAAPLYVQLTKIDCDDAAIMPFFPLGATPSLSVPCRMTTARSQSRWALIKDMTDTDNVTIDLSFAGRDHLHVAAGDFAVASVKYRITPGSSSGATFEGDWEVLEDAGVIARSTSLARFADTAMTHAVRELLKLGP